MTPELLAIEEILAAAETRLRDESPWSKVGTIVLSAPRWWQLRDQATATTSPHPWSAISLEISPFSDDKTAVLVGRDGLPLGVFSFETGEVCWLDQKLMKRFSEPAFRFDGEVIR